MRILMLSLFVCAVMALSIAAAPPLQGGQYGEAGPNDFHWEPSCPKGWSMYSMQCILYVPEIMTWDEAEANCRSNGGNLAVLFQRDEAYDIMKELQKVSNQHGPVWVGGTKNQFAPWNNAKCSQSTAEKDCLQIKFEGQGMACKDDVQCDARLPSVCGIVIM